MNFIEKILYFLQGEMDRPTSYGWYHILWIIISILFIIYFIVNRRKCNEKTLKKVLLIYGVGAFVLELLKQIIWSFNYSPELNQITWNYTWYAAPFQLCSTPIYVSLICLFLKKGKLRDSLLSYMAYITILGSLATFLYPESCFVRTILINIHTMYLHCGSLVVSLYLLITKEVNINFKSLMKGYYVFLIFAIIAQAMNLIIYNSGILNGQTFNMFYISPYFISSLPLFDVIQKNTPYLVFLLLYLLAIFLGGLIILGISTLIMRKHKKI
jgi:hypothetical protein